MTNQAATQTCSARCQIHQKHCTGPPRPQRIYQPQQCSELSRIDNYCTTNEMVIRTTSLSPPPLLTAGSTKRERSRTEIGAISGYCAARAPLTCSAHKYRKQFPYQFIVCGLRKSKRSAMIARSGGRFNPRDETCADSYDIRQSYAHRDHPVAIMLPMSDGMDDLEVALQGDDHKTDLSAGHTKDRCANLQSPTDRSFLHPCKKMPPLLGETASRQSCFRYRRATGSLAVLQGASFRS